MRTKRLVLAALLVLLCLPPASCVTSSAAQQTPEQRGVEIGALIKQVQLGLAEAQNRLAGANMLPLKSVTLDLVAEAVKSGGPTIDLVVVKFGAKWNKALTQEIEITLTPPAPKRVVEERVVPGVADLLAAAIVSAARGVQDAQSDPQVPLVATSIKATIEFVVKESVSAGGGFTVVPVTVDLGADAAQTATQRITVVFQAR